MTGQAASPLDRSNPPRSGSVRSFDFPDVSSSSLPNGLELKIPFFWAAADPVKLMAFAMTVPRSYHPGKPGRPISRRLW